LTKLLAIALLAAVLGAAAVGAQEAPAGGEAEATAPVRFDGRILFRLRGTTSYPAEQRAQIVAGQIELAARDSRISPEAVQAAPSPLGFELRAGDVVILRIVPADAALEDVRIETLAESHRQRIAAAIAQYRAERTPETLLRGALRSVAATLLFAAALFVGGRVVRRIESAGVRRVDARVARLPPGARHFVEPAQIHAVGRVLRILALIALVDVWLEFVLGQFPWTRPLGERLLMLLLTPLQQMGRGIVDFVPSGVFLIVLAVVTRYGLGLLRRFFTALERGDASLPNFDPEWALPSYKIIRTIVVALAVVMAYPYIPGSGSEALQGISVLGGLMLSLGASVAVSNVIAGYINTFGRVLRVGDLIQLGDVRGEVTDVHLLVTRVRTLKNEQVTIPNASIMSNNVINYSALAQSRGLILHTEVGIGYEVPWRQVHAMLEQAALRTPNTLQEPRPFVLQRGLGDFAVSYQINVYVKNAIGMALTYSALHQNILDVFNEHGVQIMTPAYEGDPEEPKVVARENWYAAPAPAPGGGDAAS
jgi:small-conductance mechanosensitive channel